MVEIVEFAQGRETGFQHLRADQRRDRLHVVGRQPVEEIIKGAPPCPETVCAVAALLGKPAAHGEPLQILHYGTGGEYLPQLLARPGDDDMLARVQEQGERRVNSVWERLGRSEADVETPSEAWRRLRGSSAWSSATR